MLEDEIGDVQREDGEGVVEGIVLQGGEVVEYNWTGWKSQAFKSICVCAFKDIFSDNQNRDPWNPNILLCSSLHGQFWPKCNREVRK